MNNDEPDGQDETWCLYEGEFVDDELEIKGSFISALAQGLIPGIPGAASGRTGVE
jgi:hypothetical protein